MYNNLMKILMKEMSDNDFLQFDINMISKYYKRVELINDIFSNQNGIEKGIIIRVLDSLYRYAQVTYSDIFNINAILEDINNILKQTEPDPNRLLYMENNISKKENLYYLIDSQFDLQFFFLKIKDDLEREGIKILSGNITLVNENRNYYNQKNGINEYEKNYGIVSLVLSVRDIEGKNHIYILSEDLDNLIDNYNDNMLKILNNLLVYKKYKAIELEQGEYNVVFSKSFFYYLFNKHYIKDFYNLGDAKNIYAKTLNLYDCGNLEKGFNTRPFDYEGTNSQNTILLRAGEKIGSLIPVIQAKKCNQFPTGNMIKENLEDDIKLEFTNLVFEVKKEFKGDYIYINTFGTGEESMVFSATFAIMVKNEVQIPLHGLNVKIDFRKLFTEIAKIPKTSNHIMGMYFPDIVFKNVKIFS